MDDKRKYIKLVDYPEIKRLYDEAVKDQKTVFIWDGYEMLTSYAKFLLQYLEIQIMKYS